MYLLNCQTIALRLNLLPAYVLAYVDCTAGLNKSCAVSFVFGIICPVVLKSNRSSPILCLSPPPTSHPLQCMICAPCAVQREAGGGSCLLAQRQLTWGGGTTEKLPPLQLIHISFLRQTSPSCRIFNLISCLSLPNPFI